MLTILDNADVEPCLIPDAPNWKTIPFYAILRICDRYWYFQPPGPRSQEKVKIRRERRQGEWERRRSRLARRGGSVGANCQGSLNTWQWWYETGQTRSNLGLAWIRFLSVWSSLVAIIGRGFSKTKIPPTTRYILKKTLSITYSPGAGSDGSDEDDSKGDAGAIGDHESDQRRWVTLILVRPVAINLEYQVKIIPCNHIIGNIG